MRPILLLVFSIICFAIVFVACNDSPAPVAYESYTCEALSKEIIELSKMREDSVIHKMYNIRRGDDYAQVLREAEANTTIILGCVAEARWNRGLNDSVLFWIEEDADGDHFSGWVRTEFRFE